MRSVDLADFVRSGKMVAANAALAPLGVEIRLTAASGEGGVAGVALAEVAVAAGGDSGGGRRRRTIGEPRPEDG